MQSIFDLPDDSLVRLHNIIGPGNPTPASKSTWYIWRKAGRAPAAVMLSPKVAAYRAGDVKALICGTKNTTPSPPFQQGAAPMARPDARRFALPLNQKF